MARSLGGLFASFPRYCAGSLQMTIWRSVVLHSPPRLCAKQALGPSVSKLNVRHIRTLSTIEEGSGTMGSAGHDAVDSQTVYTREQVSPDDPLVVRLVEGIKAGERASLAQAITLVETTHPRKRALAQILLKQVMEYCAAESMRTGTNSFRIGLSGPPGAGKSTHIEALGGMLTARGHKVAVLAVDPSSATTGGSLLGDKTRMPELSRDPRAYIRPSPACGNLGGVTRVTNEAIVLCEGAGYDVIIVETVGVGQSEFAVANMVDLFELLIPPAGGDELQGIKKGIVEMADIVVVNKADGDLLPAARRIQAEYISALKFIRPKSKHWTPCVRRVSSLTGDGLTDLWSTMESFRRTMTAHGALHARRTNQRALWMRSHVHARLHELFYAHSAVQRAGVRLTEMVREGSVAPGLAADVLVQVFLRAGCEGRDLAGSGKDPAGSDKWTSDEQLDLLRTVLSDVDNERNNP